ncbi:MAG: M1 family metallopeptidase [Chitinophagales bacterium]|jgi:aminopeptidase N|nr:M1 family metallopeptidase [Chitinophagales bacterium]
MKITSLLCLSFVLTTICACGFVKESRKATANVEVAVPPDSNTNDSIVEVVIAEPIEITPQNDNGKTYHPAETKINDLVHTKLSLRPDWEKRYLYGTATITLKPHFYPTDKLTLDAVGFEIRKVDLISPQGIKPLTYTYTDDLTLNIQLDKTYTRNEQYTVFIDYTAKPEELVKSKPNLYNYENKGLYFINPDNDPNLQKPQELWTQGETESAPCWFPTIDATNQKSTQEVYVTVDNKFKTLSNGTLVGSNLNDNGTRTDYWKQDQPHAPYLFALAVSNYVITTDTWKRPSDNKDIKVDYYLMPEYAPYARNIFGATPEMLTVFSKTLGVDYQWDKYSQAVVHDFIAGAMENTTCTFLYDQLNQTADELKEYNHEDIIAHELFHHWFGDLVTCESWANLSLNESFATYGEYIWFEQKYNKEKADEHLAEDLRTYLNEAVSKQEPIIRFYYTDPDTDLFDRHSYQKGGRVIHMLRNYVGDEAFYASLQKYLKAHLFGTAEINDLRQAFEDITGEDLNWFFDQWFMKPGHPILDISYAYDSTTLETKVHVQQMQTNGVVYRLPTSVDIYEKANKKQRYNITISTADTTLRFKTPQRPKLVNFDANKILLTEKNENKTIGEYLFQYNQAPNFLDRYEAILALENIPYNTTEEKNNINQFYLNALTDNNAFLRKNAIDRLNLTDNALLNQTKQSLANLATTDTDANVRSVAIARLEELADAQHYQTTFIAALKDPSDMVVSNALHALYSTAPQVAFEQVNNLETNTNNNVQMLVARIYAELGTDKQQAYFEKYLSTNTNNTYLLIDFYGDFLKRQNNNQTVQLGIQTLENIARNNPDWWLRVNAAQTIKKIKANFEEQKQQLQTEKLTPNNIVVKRLNDSISAIEQVLQNIKKGETNAKVLEYYNGDWIKNTSFNGQGLKATF